jgi:hypothetical protein
MDMKYLFNQADYQMNLKLFDTRLINYLDEKVDDILIDLKERHNNAIVEFTKRVAERQTDAKENNLTTISFARIGEGLQDIALEDNIIALLETKIIYLWKIFEIRLKELISLAYGRDTKKFHIWENIVDFFKEHKMPLNEINTDYYKLIIELKEVNNQCKHEGLKYSKRIKNVNEFSNYKENDVYIPSHQVELFYERIKDKPTLFLNDIKEAILKERLTFDDNKLKEIAKPLVERMENPEALKFIKLLIEMYGFDPNLME